MALAKGALGYCSLFALIIVWVAQSEVVQYLQLANGTTYNKPYLVTFVNHAFMALLLPVVLLWRCVRGKPGWRAGIPGELSLSSSQLGCILFGLSVVYFMGDYAWYMGLARASVTVGTAVFNSNCVFVYVFSVLLLKERLSLFKVLSVLVAVGGVVCLAMAKADNKADPSASASYSAAGPVLCVAAAVLYAVYETYFARAVGECEDVELINILSGLLGVVTILTLWPGIIVVNYVPALQEPFEAPSGEDCVLMLINGLLALAFNALFMIAVALVSPLHVSIGCLATIPVSGITDSLLFHDDFFRSPLPAVGSVLVLLAFVILTVADRLDGVFAALTGLRSCAPPPSQQQEQQQALKEPLQEPGEQSSSSLSSALLSEQA